MIALVAASSGGGGGGDEPRFTVPWCETVARKSPPEMPGHVVRHVLKMAAMMRASGEPFERVWRQRGGGYVDALVQKGVSLAEIVAFEATMQLIRELGILGEVDS